MRKFLAASSALAALAAPLAPARAATDVTFTGLVINSCVLTLGTPGLLAPSTDGQTLSSENGGGLASTLAVVAVGLAPTLNFSAPILTTPNGYAGEATSAIRYTSLGGANQPYTTASSSARAGVLLDTFTIHSRVTSPTGFSGGTYNVRTTVTCQQ